MEFKNKKMIGLLGEQVVAVPSDENGGFIYSNRNGDTRFTHEIRLEAGVEGGQLGSNGDFSALLKYLMPLHEGSLALRAVNGTKFWAILSPNNEERAFSMLEVAPVAALQSVETINM